MWNRVFVSITVWMMISFAFESCSADLHVLNVQDFFKQAERESSRKTTFLSRQDLEELLAGPSKTIRVKVDKSQENKF